MENNTQEAKPKKINDFVKTIVGIIVFIGALVLVKFALQAFHLI